TSSNVHLTMGNPSNAVTSVSSPTNYLMEKSQYVLSYNRDNATPNWVSWHLDPSWLGSTPRQDDFRADTTLPAGWYRVTQTDYSGSGYDRGHMCPSGDRTSSVANNSATFLMTNIIPQAPNNNQQSWASLESYCRTLANSGSELYVVSGGQGVSGYIAGGSIAVPTYTWKVIMVLPNGSNDVSRVTTATRLIAVVIPNQNGISTNWRDFRVSVDYVESLTGHDFFSNVPDSIENVIESTTDAGRSIDDSEFFLDKYALEEIEVEIKYSKEQKVKDQ
ncbi:MAG: DNA/RNA non-specific endonuclease, partial [Pyrinomonadaceae bacterium]|nr:DNA/RNA non-specific endonuclease [Pyrinomonadaceae bacterium]